MYAYRLDTSASSYEAACRYLYDRGLSTRNVAFEEVFVKSTLELEERCQATGPSPGFFQEQSSCVTRVQVIARARLASMFGSLVALLVVSASEPSSALAAATTRCPSPARPPVAGVPPEADSEAGALMAAIERDFRRGTRIVRMDIRTRFRKRSKFGPPFDREPNQRTLWGVFSTRRERTDLLYVFSGPGRLAGTTLLMHDYIAMDRVDAMWVYLRAFDIFEKIGARTEQLFVPGTALSYEDSRGFISTARFEFFSSDPPTDTAGAEGRAGGPAARNVWIRACPRSLAIAKQLGYSALLLNADRDKRIVRRVEYFDLSGRMFKTYTLLEESAVGDRHFAAKVELEHYANGFLTTIEYEHWQPDRAPLRTLFEPSVDSESFLDRLGAYVGEAGPGVRLEAELALADEQSREFEARLRRIKEETVNRLKDSTRKAGD